MDERHLNIIYGASLEFGKNWMRPIIELAQERIPDLAEPELTTICSYVEAVRNDINELVLENYDELVNDKVSQDKIKDIIRQRYAWMNEDNVSRGFSQGMYYAWHG